MSYRGVTKRKTNAILLFRKSKNNIALAIFPRIWSSSFRLTGSIILCYILRLKYIWRVSRDICYYLLILKSDFVPARGSSKHVETLVWNEAETWKSLTSSITWISEESVKQKNDLGQEHCPHPLSTHQENHCMPSPPALTSPWVKGAWEQPLQGRGVRAEWEQCRALEPCVAPKSRVCPRSLSKVSHPSLFPSLTDPLASHIGGSCDTSCPPR